MEYLATTNFEATSFETKTTTIEYKVHWDGYRRRMDEFIDNNYWDYTSHRQHSMIDPETGYLSCDIPRVNNDGSISKGASIDQRCSGNIEWCNSLYVSDWYELYGIHIDTMSTGPGIDYTLTDNDIQGYIEDINSKYPNLATSRKRFVQFTLENVGKINYWWGGKAEHAGWNNNWGKVAPDADLYYTYNTMYGRTVLGLDGFGFVGWCYWTKYNIQPNSSTTGFVKSVGLTPKSQSELLPGDIGLVNMAGNTNNHIGVFVGYNSHDNALWVHCNETTNNVAINSTNVFRYYYSIEQ